MSDYTPGPWKVQECYDGNYEITHSGGENEHTRLIAEVLPACNFKNDAPLIEAAPELLEALEEAYSALDYILNSDDIMFNMSEFKYENEGLEEYFKNVIKKAKGDE